MICMYPAFVLNIVSDNHSIKQLLCAVVGQNFHGVEYHLRRYCRHLCYRDGGRHCHNERSSVTI